MPLIQVKVLEGVFTESQKREIVQKLTDAMVSIEGENMRPVTWVIVEEVKSGDWGIGGKALTTAEVQALAAGLPATGAAALPAAQRQAHAASSPEPLSTPERSFADALHEAHTALLRALQELERAIGPTSSDGPADLLPRLGQVRTHLTAHFRFEEEGGYMAPVLKEEPRLHAEVQRLFIEHSQMAQALDAIIEGVGRGPSLQDSSRQQIRFWIGTVRHHETRENDLVQEAYYSSGATGD
jgi:4-oxalocrotonate tautomerase